MKSLEEMIELCEEQVGYLRDFVDRMVRAGAYVENSKETLDEYESTLAICLELKQRREQDVGLTMEMVEYLKYTHEVTRCQEINLSGLEQSCPFNATEKECLTIDDDCNDPICKRVDIWLQEQEQRLKGGGENG